MSRFVLAGIFLCACILGAAPAWADEGALDATVAPAAQDAGLGTPALRDAGTTTAADFSGCCQQPLRRCCGVRWFAAAYVWTQNMTGTSYADGEETDIDISFTDLFDHLNFAAFGYLEARMGPWFASLDGSYAALEGGDAVNVEAKMSTIDFRVGYRLWANPMQVSGPCNRCVTRCQALYAFVGARYTRTRLDATLTLDLPGAGPMETTRSQTTDGVDGLLGLRFIQPIAAQWTLDASAYVGGLGGADLLWQAEAYLSWEFAPRWHAIFGYRATGVDSTTGSGPTLNGNDLVIHGAILGVGFSW